MLVQGQIIAIDPPNYQDQWGNKYQNIVVRTVSGDVTGRIATKKPYTAHNLNQNGQFDCEEAQNNQGTYYKFKKHYDTPYQQRGQSAPQNTQQAPPQPAQATNAPYNAPQVKQRDYDAENRGKCRTQFIKAGIASNQLKCQTLQDILNWTEFAMLGIDPSKVPNPDPSIQNNPNYVGDEPDRIPDDSDIPF